MSLVHVYSHGIKLLQPLLQKELGTPGFDYPYSIITASNGDILLACTSDAAGSSGSHDNYGGEDFVLWRLDVNLNVRWVCAYGGNRNDRLFDLVEASNGNVLLIGRSASAISGTKTSPHLGGNDIWVVMVDPSGRQLWDRTFGGDDDDRGLGVLRLPSDEFLIVGQSSSPPNTVRDGKILPNYGLHDAYAVCITGSGVKKWEVCYGGVDFDEFRSALIQSDGEIVLIGSSASPAGGRSNKTVPLVGYSDLFFVAVDASGRQRWQRTYGEVGQSLSCDTRGVVNTVDGGFIIAANRVIKPNEINAIDNEFVSSGLILNFNSSGQLVRSQMITNHNAKISADQFAVNGIYFSRVIRLNDGGYLVSGGTDCVTGGVQAQSVSGYVDGFLVQIDDWLNPIASVVLGGTSNEWTPALTQLLDGTICAAIQSYSSIEGNKTVSSLGNSDAWIITLRPYTQDKLEVFSALEVHFKTSLGNRYQLQYSSDLKFWVDYGLPFSGTGGTTTNLISVLGTETRFWSMKKL